MIPVTAKEEIVSLSLLPSPAVILIQQESDGELYRDHQNFFPCIYGRPSFLAIFAAMASPIRRL
jgi:hypothetical protein